MAADRPTFGSHLNRSLHEDASEMCELKLSVPENEGQLVQLWCRRFFRPNRSLQVTIVDWRGQETERIKNEQLLDAVQSAQMASAAKDKFIAMLSHELRTPLTPVLMAASALQKQSDLPGHLRDVFAMIVRNVQMEARLVDDLLDVTRIAQGKMYTQRGPADLHALVRTACESFGVQLLDKQQSLWVELKAERTLVNVDPVRIHQLFGNLLGNAIKFTPPGGEIRVRSWNNSSNIMVEVEDDGVGIESGNVERIFEPFNQLDIAPTRTVSGLGLGLTICKGITDLHGGRIDASSRGRGQGARFVVQLPLTKQPTTTDVISTSPTRPTDEPAAGPAPPLTDSPTTCRILLVEDHEDTAELLAELLVDEGYEVRMVTSIRDALAVDIEKIDVIVSDLGLPDGSGLDLIKQLQDASSRHHPAIALSGFGTGLDVQASKKAGFDAHLTKPIDFDRLIGKIRAFDPKCRN